VSARKEVRLTVSGSTIFRTIHKNYKSDGRCMKSEKDCRFTSHVCWRTRINDSRWTWWTH